MEYTGVNLKKQVELKKNAHFEDVFQIYPSMLEKSTAGFIIFTLVFIAPKHTRGGKNPTKTKNYTIFE